MGLEMTARERVLALVAGLGALGGFTAGATGALLAVAILTPSAPVTAADKVVMVLSYGAIAAFAGGVLGTGMAYAILRRVRLGRVFVLGTTGAALGLTYGFLGGPWAWHHLHWLGIGGMAAGALVARLLGRDSREAGVEARLASWLATRVGASGEAAALTEGAMTSLDARPARHRDARLRNES